MASVQQNCIPHDAMRKQKQPDSMNAESLVNSGKAGISGENYSKENRRRFSNSLIFPPKAVATIIQFIPFVGLP